MKRATLIVLCALLGASLLAGCTKKEAAPAQPANNATTEAGTQAPAPESEESAPETEVDDGKPPVEVDEDAEDIAPRPNDENAYVDNGNALAAVSEDRVTSDSYGFTMEYPADWSYLSAAESGVQGSYIFGASNWESGSSLYIYQPANTAGSTLKDYAEIAAVNLAGASETYAALGFTSQLQDPVQTTLGGRTAWLVQLTASGNEVDLSQCIYVADTTEGYILLTYMVNTDEDKATAQAAVASFSWN